MRCPTPLRALRTACQLDPAQYPPAHAALRPQPALQPTVNTAAYLWPTPKAQQHDVGAQGEGESARHTPCWSTETCIARPATEGRVCPLIDWSEEDNFTRLGRR